MNDIWAVRHFIYQRFIQSQQAPSLEETALELNLALPEAQAAYQELHRLDAIFLEPGTIQVRMAFPFSAVPTLFQVEAAGKNYWANCAWDSLGIPAALHADARIETQYAQDQTAIHLRIEQGILVHQQEVAHFLLPFRAWYDDLVHT